MSPEEFKRLGHAMVDRIAEYLETIEDRPILAAVRPGETMAKMPTAAPDQPEPWDDILADIDRVIMPGLTHWQHPGFFGYFAANSSYPSILGDLLSAGLGVQGMLWATSPACTEVETRVCDWLGQMLALPAAFLSPSVGGSTGGGVILGTASEATLVALVAARHRARAQAASTHLVMYASTQAHSSIIKAAMIAGLAKDTGDRTHVRLIPTDDAYAMDPRALAQAIDHDTAAGKTPFYIVATVGTTSSTAIDPLEAIGPIASRHRAWLHVDAAYSGSACICPELRDRHLGPDNSGLAMADSFAVNPHKWLLTNFDCNVTWTRDRASWTGALSVTPEYLKNAASTAGSVIDYRDWQIPLGRRFRALKLWLVIRHYGISGLQAYIREHIRLAALFESWVQEDTRFQLLAPRTSGLVCFRLAPKPGETPTDTDARNKTLLDTINADGRIYLTHTILPPTPSMGPSAAPRLALRLALGASRVQEHHIAQAWNLLRSHA